MAVLLTACVTVGLTFYAMSIPAYQNFHFLGGMLASFVFGLIGVFISCFFTDNDAASYIFAMIGVLIYSGYIVLDT